MYTLPIKKWVGHFHMPEKHEICLRITHMIHSDNFWAAVIAIALVAGFLVLAIWASVFSEAPPGSKPLLPIVPPYSY